MKGLITFIRILLVLSLLGAAFLAAGAFYLNRPLDATGTEVRFNVDRGMSFSQVAIQLEQKGLIRNQYLFRIIGRVLGTEQSIRTGSYQLTSSWSTWDNYQELLHGQQEMIKVTIPEGWTINKIGKLLEEKGITGYVAFKEAVTDRVLLQELEIAGDTAEGYLFPNTYQFVPGQKAEMVVRFLVGQFFIEIDKIMPEADLSTQELHQKVILASIVEREFRTKEEAPLISSVFNNRLEQGIPLESCATIEYIITEVQGKPHPERIFYRDLEIENPYNTYRNQALPPGPISNPGAVALEAAFYPEDTDYLFFVINDPVKGVHTFSESYNQHLSAKNLYLKKL